MTLMIALIAVGITATQIAGASLHGRVAGIMVNRVPPSSVVLVPRLAAVGPRPLPRSASAMKSMMDDDDWMVFRNDFYSPRHLNPLDSRFPIPTIDDVNKYRNEISRKISRFEASEFDQEDKLTEEDCFATVTALITNRRQWRLVDAVVDDYLIRLLSFAQRHLYFESKGAVFDEFRLDQELMDIIDRATQLATAVTVAKKQLSSTTKLLASAFQVWSFYFGRTQQRIIYDKLLCVAAMLSERPGKLVSFTAFALQLPSHNYESVAVNHGLQRTVLSSIATRLIHLHKQGDYDALFMLTNLLQDAGLVLVRTGDQTESEVRINWHYLPNKMEYPLEVPSSLTWPKYLTYQIARTKVVPVIDRLPGKKDDSCANIYRMHPWGVCSPN